MHRSPRDDTDSLSDVLGPIYPLNERKCYFSRTLEDGRIIDVVPLTFGRAQIAITSADYFDGGYTNMW